MSELPITIGTEASATVAPEDAGKVSLRNVVSNHAAPWACPMVVSVVYTPAEGTVLPTALASPASRQNAPDRVRKTK